MSEEAQSPEEATSEGSEEFVTLVKPGVENDITYVSAAGPIRFVEDRARVPLSVARELAGPGWWIEP